MKRNLLCMLGLAMLLPSCSRELEGLSERVDSPSTTETRVSPLQAQFNSPGIVPHTLYIKLDSEVATQLSLAPSGSVSLKSAPTPLASALVQVQATSVKPVFNIDPRYRERSERAGLHQWYILEVNESQDLYTAAATLQSVPDVSVVEPVYEIATPEVKVIPASAPTSDNKGLPFDDPRLGDQWHYHNDGIGRSRVVGADINVFGVWEKRIVGKPNVIVAIVDGGIDTTHPDLEKNLYINKQEKDGQPGVDDDGNGHIDDVYGFNFITNKGELYPDRDSHGTHVAGTVGARNNNGIGVAGVAGGDDKAEGETGVRLMSCQIFGKEITLADGKKGIESASAADTYRYAADNGAVISQNSWGYNYPGVTSMPGPMQAAIDYFIKNAGCDEHGNQRPESPMKGGVVIFAAGNDDKVYDSYPAAYRPVIAVASMGASWKRAGYSNRGKWVDITAPGGDVSVGGWANMVLSTVKDSKYAYMQGTSMACPHVSGVAALIVSHYGKQGFTNKDLERILMSSLHNKGVDLENPSEAGLMGVGYLDAVKMLDEDKKQAPATPTNLRATEVLYNTANLNWEAVADPDDNTATYYRIYAHTQPLTESIYKDYEIARVNALGYQTGSAMSYLLTSLRQDTHYYLAIQAVDRWGNASMLTRTEINTLRNTAPVITRETDTPIRIGGKKIATLVLNIVDAEKHKINIIMSEQTLGVSKVMKGNKLIITFAPDAPVGSHILRVTAQDEYGMSSFIDIPFEVYLYHAPKFSQKVGQQAIGVGSSLSVDIAKVVTATEGFDLSYKVSVKPEGIAQVSINEQGKLTIKGLKRGAAQAVVTVNDGVSPEISTPIDLRVVTNVKDLVYSVFPVPAETELNIDVNPNVSGVKVVIQSLDGLIMYDKEFVTKGKGSLKIPVKDFAVGTYILRVSSPRETYTKTFVKR